ncbi:HlyD family efflux transporter periplasmic adaptor subunit (plasmid) [Ralstonia sp. 25C]|uniref:HlyD family efflux transporter periplasmic adaptor subunit n=1 Tax=Ralstonia sp. 25C TaxID=3447363 RepID=UPI003F74FF4B
MHREPLIDQAAAVPVRDPRKVRRRNAMFAALLGVVLAIAAVAVTYWLLRGRYLEDTDNAYVAGNVVQIAAQTAGIVRDVGVGNTECVKAGQLLVRLDPADAQIALERAKAQLTLAVRRTREGSLTSAMYEDAVRARAAELTLAERALAARSGASAEVVSEEELARSRMSVEQARANLAAARNQVAASRAVVGDVRAEDNPAVADAAQQVRAAYLQLARMTIVAPVDGCVVQRSVQVGQPIGAGAQLMAIVPLSQLWVEANLKEGQIRNVRIGQPVEVVSDLYGADVVFRGHIAGLSPGTGGAFSMLPPQNAAGNWVKVVQRVPVMVALDPAEMAARPLPIGVSMTVSIDTHERQGRLLGAVPTAPRPVSLATADPAMAQADTLVRTLLAAAQAGGRPSGSVAATSR